MKKQSILRLLIVAVIISATFFVMAATRSSNRVVDGTEECPANKTCEPKVQSEFFLESLTRSLLAK